MKRRIFLLAVLGMIWLPSPLQATEDPDLSRYQVGMRSAILLGTMRLSKIDPDFGDLDTAGLKGPHHSGVFLLYAVKPYLRVGFETLVGNSNNDARTTMDFQAAGGVAELRHGGEKVFVHGGLHAGFMIADALRRDQDLSETRVHAGTHYKSSGFFVAPYVGVGMKIRAQDLSVFVKRVQVFSEKSEDEIGAFSTTYGGVSLGFGL